MTKFLAKLTGAILGGLVLAGAVSAQEYRTDWTTVDRLLIHETEFGGCLAMLGQDARGDSLENTTGGECSNWAAFSCTGVLNDVDTALRMFEAAQIAYLTSREVRVTVDSSRKHNGHCVATRFDYR